MTPLRVATALWVIWALSWLLAAIWASRPRSRAATISQLPYRLITTAGFVLLFGFGHTGYYSLPQWAGWILTVLTGVGFGLAWWARLHLGKLWSAFVTRKEEHRVIETGPYRIVRHPIYTGIILAALAIAILKANLYALIGAFLVVVGFWIKARLEERFLSQELGPETYAAYRRRVPMLIPFFSP
jgi:protein-S-isoprenylcysteine O-methyltransferase Ste14